MKLKYKVRDAANDFGVKPKDITEEKEKYTGVSKKTMTALEDTDMNILFEHFTKANQVESLDSYFAVRDKAIEEKQVQETAEKKPEENKKETQPKPQQKTEAKPEPKPKAEKTD